MGRNFERELPAGYGEIYTIDAKSKKTGLLLNGLALALLALTLLPLLALILPAQGGLALTLNPGSLLLLCLFMLLYIVLHELTHGAAYYLLTKEKLTFGLSFTVAYCGVPGIYVYKKTALLSLLAPFTLFSVLFILGIVLSQDLFWKLGFALLFAVHFSGCAGDLYDTALLLLKLKDNILMKDTGPKQTFYSTLPQ